MNDVALLKLATPVVFNSSAIGKTKLPKGPLNEEEDGGGPISLVAFVEGADNTTFPAKVFRCFDMV